MFLAATVCFFTTINSEFGVLAARLTIVDFLDYRLLLRICKDILYRSFLIYQNAFLDSNTMNLVKHFCLVVLKSFENGSDYNIIVFIIYSDELILIGKVILKIYINIVL